MTKKAKSSIRKYSLAMVLVMLMLVTCMGAAASADDQVLSVTYLRREWNRTEVDTTSVTEEIPVVPSDGSMTGGKYFLNRDVTVNDRVLLTGSTELILGDGYTLDVEGLYIPAGSTLTIYGQAAGTGKIYSHPSGGAAIGGYSGHGNGNIVIHGGTIEANGYDHCAGIGSNDGLTGGAITIYGGTITAIGGSDGAAIGGGRNCDGGTITIYGGDITANGPTDSYCPANGAGIGGGDCGDGGTITIYGGTITTYSRDGAGIGGGDERSGGTITIHGGTITSTKVNQGQGARIGGGCDAAPGTIVINDGNITTVGGTGAGIGGGKGNTSGGSVTVNGGVINASGSYGIGSGEGGADVAITLDYTEATRDTISITAASFGGTVTLNQPFQNWDGVRLHPPGTADKTYMINSPLIAWDRNISSWARLQFAIDVAEDGSTISLTENIIAKESYYDKTLLVPESKSITIDLCGFKVDRNPSIAGVDLDGCVIINKGTLTITDSKGNGEIIGGSNINYGAYNNTTKHNGGGIYNSGTLTLNGGTISGNDCIGWGGGVYLADGAVLNLNGGTIASNQCGSECNGGGIHVSEGATLNVSGNPVVSGNKKGSTVNNVNLANGALIQVTDTLADTASIGISVSNAPTSGSPRVLTGGLSGKAAAENFISDKEEYGVGLNADGEAQLCTFHSVTIASDIENGSVNADRNPANYIQGSTVTLTVQSDEDYVISALTVKYGNEDVACTKGEANTYTFIMPAADVTVSAVFSKQLHSVVIDTGIQNGTVTTDPAAAVEGTTVTLSVSPAKDYILNGLTVKNGNQDVAYLEGENDTYTFTMPAAEVTVTATFVRIYGITVNTTHGTMQSDKESAAAGELVKLTPLAENGYRFVDGSIDVRDETGAPVTVSSDNTFIMPASAVTVTAQFEGLPNQLTAWLTGSQYGSYTVSVNGQELTLSEDGSQEFTGVRTGDMITIAFSPKENGCIDEFYLEDAASHMYSRKGYIRDYTDTFSMPAGNTSIVTKFAYSNSVETVNYVDENGTEYFVQAFVLTGEEKKEYHSTSSGFYYFVSLGADSGSAPVWYVVDRNVSYSRSDSFKLNLELKGDVRMIVSDGATLSVEGEIADGTLSVYGQTHGTGRLEAGSVISRSGAVNVYGGELSTGSILISDEKSLIIKNGKLTVTGNVSCGHLDISGGVTSIGGQAAAKTITLGCGDLDDSITIGAYDSDSISVAEGQTLRGDNGTDYSGTLGSSSAAGQTLRLTQFFTVFDTAEFTLPAQLIRVEDSAFEGLDVKSVYIPDCCTSIGIYAFKGCTNLIRIRIPAGCTVGADAFVECEKVYIFGSVGSSAEYYCRNHSNCVFVAETQN